MEWEIEDTVPFNLLIWTPNGRDDCSRDLNTYQNHLLGWVVLEDGGLVGDGALAFFVDGLASITNVVTLGANVLATGTIQELILSLLSGL